jgi:hypothetical protein
MICGGVGVQRNVFMLLFTFIFFVYVITRGIKCWWGNLRERGRWGDPDIDGRIILRWIFRKLEGIVGTGWSWFRIGTGGGHL